jgi:hypothetical protein
MRLDAIPDPLELLLNKYAVPIPMKKLANTSVIPFKGEGRNASGLI